MVRTQKAKKLTLSRDTLRRLSPTELRGVHGASTDTSELTFSNKVTVEEKHSCGDDCKTSLDNNAPTQPMSGPINDP